MKLHTKPSFKSHLIAAAAASVFGVGMVSAQTTTNVNPATPTNPNAVSPTTPYTVNPTTPRASPMVRPIGRTDADATRDSDLLERSLQSVTTRTGYAKALQQAGFRISAINADTSDYLEYEVVKGARSYEVQLDFDNGATRATEIDVAPNVWRADATKRMMEDANYQLAGPITADPSSRYSDRRYMAVWNDEKAQLEKALNVRMPATQIKPTLERMGYQITSVNDRDATEVEYEIVKGDNSYEVEINVDPGSRIAQSVDIQSNLWDSDATERAKERNEAKVSTIR